MRVTFAKGTNGEAEILQSLCWTCFSKDHYYPFGMRMSGQHYNNTELINKHLYNGKEQQEQTNYYDYGFRQFDAQLGRWHVSDALAERYFSQSPYNYVGNNPVSRTDFMGLQYDIKRIEWEREHLSGGHIMDVINGIKNYLYNSTHNSYRAFLGQMGNSENSSNSYVEFLSENNMLSSGGKGKHYTTRIGMREMVRDDYLISKTGNEIDIRYIGTSDSYWETYTYKDWENDKNEPDRDNFSFSSLVSHYIKGSGKDYVLSKKAFDKLVLTLFKENRLNILGMKQVKDYSKELYVIQANGILKAKMVLKEQGIGKLNLLHQLVH